MLWAILFEWNLVKIRSDSCLSDICLYGVQSSSPGCLSCPPVTSRESVVLPSPTAHSSYLAAYHRLNKGCNSSACALHYYIPWRVSFTRLYILFIIITVLLLFLCLCMACHGMCLLCILTGQCVCVCVWCVCVCVCVCVCLCVCVCWSVVCVCVLCVCVGCVVWCVCVCVVCVLLLYAMAWLVRWMWSLMMLNKHYNAMCA